MERIRTDRVVLLSHRLVDYGVPTSSAGSNNIAGLCHGTQQVESNGMRRVKQFQVVPNDCSVETILWLLLVPCERE